MQNLFGASAQDSESEWLSVSDLMAGLMVIFLFIAISFISSVTVQNEKIKEIARTWHENETEIQDALKEEFEKDLERWGAEIDEEDKLLIRFKSPEVLFESGRAVIRPKFAMILREFFPRYVTLLDRFQDSIEEVRIEGHTSSDWQGSKREDAYFLNMGLSQDRTRAVLQNALNLRSVAKDRVWLQPLLTANGLSSSHLVLDENDAEDGKRSRRVEFRIRTITRTEIVRILETVESEE